MLAGFTGAVYVDTHFCTGIAHDGGLNDPPALLSLSKMVPDRKDWLLDVSVTWTENEIVSLDGSVPEVGCIAVLVGSSLLIVRVAVPALWL